MASTPAYASTPHVGSVALSTADSSRTAPTNVGTVFTAVAAGSRIDRATVHATGTTTLGLVRLFLHDGSAYHLIREVQIQPVTPSTTQAAFAVDITFDGGINIASGWSLRATTANSEAFKVTAYGADF